MTRRAIRGNSYASGCLWPPFLPSQPVDVTHSDGFYQNDEQQREGGCVVIEDVEPVVASLHGEYQADDAVNETHDTCVERAEHTWESNCEGKHAVLWGVQVFPSGSVLAVPYSLQEKRDPQRVQDTKVLHTCPLLLWCGHLPEMTSLGKRLAMNLLSVRGVRMAAVFPSMLPMPSIRSMTK